MSWAAIANSLAVGYGRAISRSSLSIIDYGSNIHAGGNLNFGCVIAQATAQFT